MNDKQRLEQLASERGLVYLGPYLRHDPPYYIVGQLNLGKLKTTDLEAEANLFRLAGFNVDPDIKFTTFTVYL